MRLVDGTFANSPSAAPPRLRRTSISGSMRPRDLAPYNGMEADGSEYSHAVDSDLIGSFDMQLGRLGKRVVRPHAAGAVLKHIGVLASRQLDSRRMAYWRANSIPQLRRVLRTNSLVEGDDLSFYQLIHLQKLILGTPETTSRPVPGLYQPLSERVWELDSKPTTYRLVDSLGIKRPEILARYETACDIAIPGPETRSLCIKPDVGASDRGVFLLLKQSSGRWRELRSGRQLELSDVRAEAAELVAKRWTSESYFAERLVLDPATGSFPDDLKLFCFRGKVGLVLRVSRRSGVRKCRYFMPDGTPLSGVEPDFESSQVECPPDLTNLLDIGQRISRAVSLPFLRVDLLVREDGEAIFGENTPSPGIVPRLDITLDRMLGRMFAESLAELIDLAESAHSRA